MKIETINRIVLNSSNELVIMIIGNGDYSYQYIYREAAGVYWDQNQKGFKSMVIGEWTLSKWFFHIKDIVKEGLNVHLEMSESVIWESIPISEQVIIKEALKY